MMPYFEVSKIIKFRYKDLYGDFEVVRIYPIYRGKFGHYNWLGFSSSVYPFVTKICNFLPLRIVVQIKQKLQVKKFIGRAKKYAKVSNPSEITPVDGICETSDRCVLSSNPMFITF